VSLESWLTFHIARRERAMATGCDRWAVIVLDWESFDGMHNGTSANDCKQQHERWCALRCPQRVTIRRESLFQFFERSGATGQRNLSRNRTCLELTSCSNIKALLEHVVSESLQELHPQSHDEDGDRRDDGSQCCGIDVLSFFNAASGRYVSLENTTRFSGNERRTGTSLDRAEESFLESLAKLIKRDLATPHQVHLWRLQVRWRCNPSIPRRYEKSPLLSIQGRYFEHDFSTLPFRVTSAYTETTVDLWISEAPNTHHAGTGVTVWDGAVLLARYLEAVSLQCKNECQGSRPVSSSLPLHDVHGRRVLELGAGCGLVGIVASCALRASATLLTDLPCVQEILLQNVARNRVNEISIPSGSSKPIQKVDCQCTGIQCAVCDWRQRPIPASVAMFGPDIILVADCVWLESLVFPLLRILDELTRTSRAVVLMSYQQRGRDAHEALLQGMGELFEIEVVDWKRALQQVPTVYRCVSSVPTDLFQIWSCTRREDNI
jgi:Lysine methyltransferase